MTFNVLLVGERGAGKTSLLSRLFDKRGGTASSGLQLLGGKPFNILDPVNNVVHNLFSYRRKLNLVIVCLDLTQPSTTDEADLIKTLAEIKKNSPHAAIILVWTKLDLIRQDDLARYSRVMGAKTEKLKQHVNIDSIHQTSVELDASLEALKQTLIETNPDDELLNISISNQTPVPTRARFFHDHPIVTGVALGASLSAILLLTGVLHASLMGLAVCCLIIVLSGALASVSVDKPKPNLS